MPAPKGNRNSVGNKGGGRKTAYLPKYAAQAAKAYEAGFTDADIAELIGVCETTIHQWKKDHVEFAEAQKKKTVADENVKVALYKRATGYTCKDTHFSAHDGVVTATEYDKHYPPDTTACIFWLKNRQPEQWRDVSRHEHTGKDGSPIQLEHASAADLKRDLMALGALDSGGRLIAGS